MAVSKIRIGCVLLATAVAQGCGGAVEAEPDEEATNGSGGSSIGPMGVQIGTGGFVGDCCPGTGGAPLYTGTGGTPGLPGFPPGTGGAIQIGVPELGGFGGEGWDAQ